MRPRRLEASYALAPRKGTYVDIPFANSQRPIGPSLVCNVVSLAE
jgi:hypothetical protein